MDASSKTPAQIQVELLEPVGFQPFGDVIQAGEQPTMWINQGRCGRFHNLARLAFVRGHAGVSLFRSQPVELPHRLEMMERHPLGSQAFLPLSERPFLVIVAPDNDGAPGTPRAFVTEAGQGVNLLRNVWHGVLTPLHATSDFAVIDRIADDPNDPVQNLEEHWFEQPPMITGLEGRPDQHNT
ncbi:MAG: ureidoglycolate lyase [Neomegalonema sp.]|nr:ureidoglycolate lyase [Neomegalonema sp.]